MSGARAPEIVGVRVRTRWAGGPSFVRGTTVRSGTYGQNRELASEPLLSACR